MKKRPYCIDFYGERLKIGDIVIPVLEEALIIGFEGIISKIEYNEKYNNYYITISDKEGNILLDGVDARYYTTNERFEERENQDYVYSIIFYDSKFSIQTSLPLTNKTSIDYEIPEDVALATIKADHIDEITENSNSYICSDIYYLVNNRLAKVYKEGNDYDDNEEKYYYLLSNKDNNYKSITENFRTFRNDKEFKQFIREIIKYFNNSDLTHINTAEIFDENEKAKVFEKNLINRLNN